MTKKKEEIVDQEMTQQVDESVVKELVAKAKEHDAELRRLAEYLAYKRRLGRFGKPIPRSDRKTRR